MEITFQSLFVVFSFGIFGGFSCSVICHFINKGIKLIREVFQ